MRLLLVIALLFSVFAYSSPASATDFCSLDDRCCSEKCTDNGHEKTNSGASDTCQECCLNPSISPAADKSFISFYEAGNKFTFLHSSSLKKIIPACLLRPPRSI